MEGCFVYRTGGCERSDGCHGHENMMAIADLPAPGGQRFWSEEHNRIFMAQEARGETLTEI